MKREEDEEETSSSEEEDEYIAPPIPIEKRVRIIDPKEEAEARAVAALLAAENIGQSSTSIAFPSTSSYQSEYHSASKDQERDTTVISSEDLQAPIEAGYSGTPQEERQIQDTTVVGVSREASVLGSEEEESSEEILPPIFVEKKVRIIDPKEMEELKIQEEIQRRTEVGVDETDADWGSNRSSETSFLLSYINGNKFAEEGKFMNLIEDEIHRTEDDKVSKREGEEYDTVSRREGEEDDKLNGKEQELKLDENLEAKRYIDNETQISMSSPSSSSSEKSRDVQKRVIFGGLLMKDDSDIKPHGSAGPLEKTPSELTYLSGFSQTSSDRPERKHVSFETSLPKQDETDFKGTDIKREVMTGKQSLYSKYVDQSASIMRTSRQSFLYDFSQTEVTMLSSSDVLVEEPYYSDDFTHGYRENKRYIIPPMTEHEIHRLGGNKFLEDVHKSGTEATCSDHIALSLAYMTVNVKRDLKEIFGHISKNMQSIGKVYSARMLGRYHEYARMFKYSGGNEGIVASMRFTSHCSDIIKSYIQLAELVEEPEDFTNIIMALAKRHAKLGLNLRDHQLHFRPFIEILGSTSEDRMQIYSKTFFFVSLVSRAMLLAEQKMRKSSPSQDIYMPMTSRSTKSTKPKPELSRKQPIWD